MKILFLAAEVAPFAKVGGLADVAGSLPLALAALGHDVRVAMPRYPGVDPARYDLQTVVPSLDVPLGGDKTGTAILQGFLPAPPGGPQVPIYFVQNQHHFERPGPIYGYADDGDRFAVFCRAALLMLPHLNWRPDLVHANDWHTAFAPNMLKTIYEFDSYLAGIKTAFTIHNLAYQGWLGLDWLRQGGLERWGSVFGDREGQVNMMGRGIAYADAVSTVSPTYAAEILTPEYGEGLEEVLNHRWGHLWGILNGLDYYEFNPATDPHLLTNYDHTSTERRAANKAFLQQEAGLPQAARTPLVAMISRLADQKGFDLVAQAAEEMLAKGLQLVVLGTGEPRYQDFLNDLSGRYPQQVRAWLKFDLALAQHIYAGSDLFLMPSRFEPCGLGQLLAMRYGSIPLVRYTGGLADTVHEYTGPGQGNGNGFVFGPYEASHLLAALDRALAVYARPAEWQDLIRLNMQLDFSWTASAHQYLDFYRLELGLE